jgi:hypothetical protein
MKKMAAKKKGRHFYFETFKMQKNPQGEDSFEIGVA